MRLPVFSIFLFSLLSTWNATAVLAEDPPAFLAKWGTSGSGDGQFNFPRRLDVTPGGTVYVSDRNNSRIQKFTSTGVFLTKWGTSGSGDGQFNFPFGVAASEVDGHVFVAERNNDRIQRFTPGGVFVTKWGSAGAGNGQFNFPIAIDLDAQGNVYVGDAFNERIQVFDPTGVFLRKWGFGGSGDGQFSTPVGIAVSHSGFVYVGDSGNNRIQKFTLGGAFVAKWGTQGSGDGQFQSPRGVGIDGDGNVYVADTINDRIQKFTAAGVFLTKWGSGGQGNGHFDRPEDVEVDAAGNIYVADSGNNRVQKFGPAIVPVTLVSFTARRVGQTVELDWEIAHASQSAVTFDVYREATGPGVINTGIQRINPAPILGRIAYTFVDRAPPISTVAYYLRETGPDGITYTHGPVTVSPAGPRYFGLRTAAPNPFNPTTTITFVIPEAGTVSLRIFDATGRLVRNLVSAPRNSGEHTVVWDGRDDSGGELASGVYFLRLAFRGQVESRRVVLLK